MTPNSEVNCCPSPSIPNDADHSVKARLRREFSQVPVTSLAFYQSVSQGLILLAGEDNELKAYEVASGRLICQVRIFEAQPIHGIDVYQGATSAGAKVLLWGSRSVAICPLDGLEDDKQPSIIRARAPDWVYRGRFSPFDPSVAVLATAHNEVVRIRHDTALGRIIFEGIISPARPNLYSAHLIWLADDCVLMAAGTAFGEILVWKCWISGDHGDSYEMLFVLTGHEGSIYGVDISPLLYTPDGNACRLLATCSDDRTVRIWDITEREGNKRIYDKDHFSTARETGFSASLPDQSQPSMGAVAPVAVAMGHLSRIWGVKLVTPKDGILSDAGLAVYTFGEDSTTHKWRLDVNMGSKAENPLSGRLVQEGIISLHDGKHLWSHAITSTETGHLIATGGADSKISLIEEPSSQPNSTSTKPTQINTVDVRNICGASASDLSRSKRPESFGRFDFISQDQLLVISSTGRLLLGSFNGEDFDWQRVEHDHDLREDLKRCYVLKRATQGTALLGTTSGNIYFYNGTHNRLYHVIGLSSKIVDISCLSPVLGHCQSGQLLDILVHSFGSEDPQYLQLDPETGALRAQEQVLGLDPRWVPVSSARVGEYLVMGSRHGFLSVLRYGRRGYERTLDYDSHCRDAITYIVPLPNTTSSQIAPKTTTKTYFLATSRDSKYRIYEINQEDSTHHLNLCHESSPPFGPVIDGAWFTADPSPELVLYGFRSTQFIVWNETRREERASVECGGVNRSYSLHHGPSDLGIIRFAFTKSSKLSIYSQTRPCRRSLKRGTHGREIRGLSSNGRYIATGAEDTSIRIWKYQEPLGPAGAEMRCVASIKSHVTGLQTLKWLGDDYLFSSAGNEEFFVWRIRQLDAAYSGLGIVREGVFDDKSADGDLRIMDFDVQRTREDAQSLVITLVFSNSALRTYRYEGGNFHLAAKGSYTGACLTQCRHLGPLGEDFALLTASTDGHLAIWQTRLDEQQDRVFVIDSVSRVHQSAIKCLDMVSADSGYCVLTGGDDNGLGITIINSAGSNTGKPRVSNLGIVRKAHAASISGVIAAQQGPSTSSSRSRICAVIVSNDQRVRAWRLTPHAPQSIELIADAYSGVADPGDVDLVDQGRRIMVGGVGLEVWSLVGQV